MDREQLHIPSLIKLEVLRSLLGEVNPSLRGLAFDWDEKKNFAFLVFYNDGKLNDSLEDHYSCIDNEASARFFFEDRLIEHDYKVIQKDYPEKLPDHENWVYRRREPFVDPS